MIRVGFFFAVLSAVASDQGARNIDSLVSDDAKVEADSEFNISFPLENHPARKIIVRSSKGRASAEMHSSKKMVKFGRLSAQEYKEFIARIRELDEQQFEGAAAECQEPYTFRIRVGDRQRLFSGCRGLGSNASAISRLARDIEFRLLRAVTSEK